MKHHYQSKSCQVGVGEGGAIWLGHSTKFWQLYVKTALKFILRSFAVFRHPNIPLVW